MQENTLLINKNNNDRKEHAHRMKKITCTTSNSMYCKLDHLLTHKLIPVPHTVTLPFMVEKPALESFTDI
jgi:hypothetical protein